MHLSVFLFFSVSPELRESMQKEHKWLAPLARSYIMKSESGLLQPQTNNKERARLDFTAISGHAIDRPASFTKGAVTVCPDIKFILALLPVLQGY